MQRLRVLITVKTYPNPSATYDELVCTAGLDEAGNFVRLYPIRFRDLPWDQQYQKYQWIEVMAEKHRRDPRKESWRPRPETIQFYGEPIKTRNGDWSARGKYVLKNVSRSMEELWAAQRADNTSLGIIRPRVIEDLLVKEEEERDWKPSALAALNQCRFWEDRHATRLPPRKIPFKFRYKFWCNDERCKSHEMMNEDWELGALYWRLRDRGDSEDQAVEGVKQRFFTEMCDPSLETYLFVGTVLRHGTWVVVGTFYPKLGKSGSPIGQTLEMFPN